MPGYLTEKMGVESMSLELNPRHFNLLRLARMRRLEVRPLGRGVYMVSSYSNAGHYHKVAAGVCSCPAVGYCTHLALAIDAEIKREALPSVYLEYMNAQREDFAALELRVILGEETPEDKAFTRPLIEKVRARQEPFAARERAECSF